MDQGTVKWFDASKGYGFIQTSEGKDIFVHYSGIAKKGYKVLEQGQRVSFSVTDGKRGPQATEVLVLE